MQATPEEIWPWIVQMGDQRAGFYSYDWFDNRGRRSSERVVPELQGLAVGDTVPISPWWPPWAVALGTAVVFALIFYGRPPLWIGTALEAALLAGLLGAWRFTARLGEVA